MQRFELSLLAKLPGSQRNLITEGQPVILEIVVTEQTRKISAMKMSANERAYPFFGKELEGVLRMSPQVVAF